MRIATMGLGGDSRGGATCLLIIRNEPADRARRISARAGRDQGMPITEQRRRINADKANPRISDRPAVVRAVRPGRSARTIGMLAAPSVRIPSHAAVTGLSDTASLRSSTTIADNQEVGPRRSTPSGNPQWVARHPRPGGPIVLPAGISLALC